MKTARWTFEVDGHPHTVELRHAEFSGKRTISVDGEVRYEGRRAGDMGSTHVLVVDGRQVAVNTFQKALGLSYDHELTVDGERIARASD